MERRVTSHTEEEELNQRKQLLDLARKGNKDAIARLLELYQVQVYSGDNLPGTKPPKKPTKNVKTEKGKTPTPAKSNRSKKWSEPVASSSKEEKSSAKGKKDKKGNQAGKKAAPQTKSRAKSKARSTK